MSIGAIAGLAGPAMGLVGEALKMGTEIAKMATQMAKSQSGNKEGGGDQHKIAHEAMHNKDRVNFSNSDSTNNNVNINFS
jgi:galactitol-specific phosphotransferase system IIC component